MIHTCKFARENKKPFLGICLGMQVCRGGERGRLGRMAGGGRRGEKSCTSVQPRRDRHMRRPDLQLVRLSVYVYVAELRLMVCGVLGIV